MTCVCVCFYKTTSTSRRIIPRDAQKVLSPQVNEFTKPTSRQVHYYTDKRMDHSKGCLEIINSASGQVHYYKWIQVYKWTNPPSPQVDEFTKSTSR